MDIIRMGPSVDDMLKLYIEDPEPRRVSMKSGWFKDSPLSFKWQHSETEQNRPGSPEPSCVSMKSDRSKDFPPSFNLQHLKTEQNRPDSPEPSCVSMKSDRSKDFPPSFNLQHSKETSDGSTDRRSPLDSIFMCLEENVVGFVKKKLKIFKEMLSPDYPECPEDQCEDEGVVDEEEAQRRYSSKLVLDMTLLFMRRMNLGELAASLEKRSKRLLESVAKNTKQNAAFPGLMSAISVVFSTCFR
ncbi:uncharacterized protein LOC119005895 isoform X2 [Acanthopagrus latus]|uniref:uncharacterized protein LOC119005895 isoform X2 n=1 Tax=Acanthopagrus latus TaxID=8177 RepID=UPI00187C0FFC|nr:uncharacterized protein LOC119005895 isoform X2 [Acanthopagrus latus]